MSSSSSGFNACLFTRGLCVDGNMLQSSSAAEVADKDLLHLAFCTKGVSLLQLLVTSIHNGIMIFPRSKTERCYTVSKDFLFLVGKASQREID